MIHAKRSPLKAAIFNSGLTQLEVARRVGVYRTRISLWANGWEPVPQKWRNKLAQVLKKSVAEIFSHRAIQAKTGKMKKCQHSIELSEVKSAIKRMLDNWEKVSPYINNMCALSANRGMPYTGPTLNLEELRKIIKE